MAVTDPTPRYVKTVKTRAGIHCDGCKKIVRIGHEYEVVMGGLLYCHDCSMQNATAKAGSME